mgnify:CR=1 FL=1
MVAYVKVHIRSVQGDVRRQGMMCMCVCVVFFFFFNDTATTKIYTGWIVGSVSVYKRQPTGLHRVVVCVWRSGVTGRRSPPGQVAAFSMC